MKEKDKLPATSPLKRKLSQSALPSPSPLRSGFFLIFTVALLVTHATLIACNMSTVEHMNMRRMKEREERVMGRLHPWWRIRARRQTRAEWDEEGGRIGKEGHMWWLGSTRKNWEAVMGDRVWTWFCECACSIR